MENSIYFIFYNSFRFTAKWSRKYRKFPYTPCPNICIASPITSISCQSGTYQYITIDELMLTNHYQPKSGVYKSIVFTFYNSIHFWQYGFYGFVEMYNDICLPLEYHTKQFHCLKNPLCSGCSSLPFPQFLQPWIFQCSHSCGFSSLLYSWNHTYHSWILHLAFFTLCNSLEIHPGCFMYAQFLFFFNCWQYPTIYLTIHLLKYI